MAMCYCDDPNCEIFYGQCHCGCGQYTALFRYGSKREGVVAGEPRQYILNHKRKYTEGAKGKITKARTYLTHGEYVDGKITPTYSAWREMQRRCYNPERKDYRYYGGRGITICKEWLESFPKFREDMGECPTGLSIDRLNVNGNYEPGNCRWASKTEQMNNRRNNFYVQWEGHTITTTQLAAKSVVSASTLRQRLNRGIPLEEAVFTPAKLMGKYAKLA